MIPAAESVVIALGSNVGNPEENVTRGINALRRFARAAFKASSLWQTTPVDCPPGSPVFTNAVVLFLPLAYETPESLLNKLQEIERQFGRKPKLVLNEPRPLDLDIIAFGQQVRNTKDLVLPHPRAHLRRFVLGPLAEIAPSYTLPRQLANVTDLLVQLPAES